jgi:hypothetical protein
MGSGRIVVYESGPMENDLSFHDLSRLVTEFGVCRSIV